MQTSDVLIVLTTMPDQNRAQALASHLVDSAMAACINILPQMVSVYRWQGELKIDHEQMLVIKTTRAQYPALEAAIRDRHPYELPEILALPAVDGLPEYRRWIGECCG